MLAAGALMALVLLAERNSQAADPVASRPATVPRQLELPKEARLLGLHLLVSRDYRFVFFLRGLKAGEKPRSLLATTKYEMLDAESGKTVPVESLLPAKGIGALAGGTGEIVLSPDGKQMLVVAVMIPGTGGPMEVCALFLVDLKTRTTRKIASGILTTGKWVGNRIAITSIGLEQVLPIKIMGSDQQQTKDLAIRGQVVAGDPKGAFLVVLADPERPAAPANLKQAWKSWNILVIDTKGKVLRNLGPAQAVDWINAMISPGGKYFAFRERETLGQTKHIRVMSTTGPAARILKEQGKPIWVTDKGDVVVRSVAVETKGEGKGLRLSARLVIKVWGPEGKARELFPGIDNIADAVVAGSRLYYATVTKDRKVVVTWRRLKELLEQPESKPL